MAYTPSALSRNSGVAATMNAVTSLGITSATGIVAMVDDESLGFFVEVRTTQMGEVTFTFKKGARWGSDLGDLTVIVGPTTSDAYSVVQKFIGPFESYRFKDADGNMTFTSSWAVAPATSAQLTYAQFAVFKMPNKV